MIQEKAYQLVISAKVCVEHLIFIKLQIRIYALQTARRQNGQLSKQYHATMFSYNAT